jgi:hypothetical protein
MMVGSLGALGCNSLFGSSTAEEASQEQPAPATEAKADEAPAQPEQPVAEAVQAPAGGEEANAAALPPPPAA